MPLAVGHVCNQVERRTFGVAEQPVDGLDQHPHDVDVFPLVETADVVCVSHFPLMENKVDGTGVVFDIQPVAHVFAFSVYRQLSAVADVVDKQRNQLLGKLVWTIVVGAVGHDCRHPVGVVKCAHKMVARRLRCRIRRVRIVVRCLKEKVLSVGMVMLRRRFGGKRRLDAFGVGYLQCAIDFIGRDVVEAFAFVAFGKAFPILLGGLQQRQSSHHVGSGKRERVLD